MAHSKPPGPTVRATRAIFTWSNGLRTLGVIGFLHELFVHEGAERFQTLVICALLLGLPEFARLDRKDSKD